MVKEGKEEAHGYLGLILLVSLSRLCGAAVALSAAFVGLRGGCTRSSRSCHWIAVFNCWSMSITLLLGKN